MAQRGRPNRPASGPNTTAGLGRSLQAPSGPGGAMCPGTRGASVPAYNRRAHTKPAAAKGEARSHAGKGSEPGAHEASA